MRGAEIEPGDIDLVCSGEGARSLGVIFADALIEPVVFDPSSQLSDYWGRAFLTARLEWIGAPKAGVDSPSPVDFGPIAVASPAAWHSSTRGSPGKRRAQARPGAPGGPSRAR